MALMAKHVGVVGLALLLAGFGATAAGAQAYSNPNMPRSPYPLPPPTDDDYHDPTAETAPPWRHWGDWKQGGELQAAIMGAYGQGAYAPPPPEHVDDWQRRKYCHRHPGACDE